MKIPMLSFKDLCRIEPKLTMLQEQVAAIKDDKGTGYFCSNDVWYDSIKPQIVRLVGDFVEKPADPALTTWQAYDVVYHTLYEQLPACRNCGCL